MKNLSVLFLLIIFLSVTTMISAGNGPGNDSGVIKLKVDSDPTVSFRIWFKVGSQDDPKGKEGLAYIVSSLLSEGGTKTKTYSQILEEMVPLAASYSANLATEMTIYSGRVHKDNLKEYMPYFTEQILNPGFREEDFNRAVSDAINYLSTTLRYSSDEELGKAVLYNSVFAGTEYQNTLYGTISGLKNITLADAEAFYKKYFNRNNFVLGIGGGFDESLVNELMAELKKLPEGVENTKKPGKPTPVEGLNVTIVEKNANATAISMGFPINLKRGEREWYALAIANSWLGEHRNSSSHLYQVIREERGLNYGDYSYIEHFPNGGRLSMPPVNVARNNQMFEIWIRPVPNETRHFALRAALRELTMLVDNGMSKEEFELTKGFLKKYVLHYAPTVSARLGYAIDDRFYGINGSHLEKFRKMMDEITLDEVNAAIKKHLQYKNMQIAIITDNAQALKDALVNDSPSPITYSTPKSEEILKEDKIIEVFPVKISPEKIRILKTEELFNQ